MLKKLNFKNTTNSPKKLSLLVFLLVLFGIITNGLIQVNIRKAEPVEEPVESPEKVLSVYGIEIEDNLIYTSAIAEVFNENVVNVESLNSGIVDTLRVDKGEKVQKGQRLMTLQDDYEDSAIYDKRIDQLDLQINMAKRNLTNLKLVMDEKKDLANLKYEDILNRLDFTELTLEDTKRQIRVIETQIEDMEDQLDSLYEYYADLDDAYRDDDLPDQTEPEKLNRDSSLNQANSAILSQEQAIEQLKSTLERLRIQKEELEYNIDQNDNPQLQMSELERDISVQELESQEKILELQIESAELNKELEVLNQEIKNTVISPVSGTIEDILTEESNHVGNGQVLFTITTSDRLNMRIKMSPNLVGNIDESEDVLVFVNNIKAPFDADIDFISTIPTQDGFYEIILDPIRKLEDIISPGQNLTVQVPVLEPEGTEEKVKPIFIPIDTVFVTNTEEFVFIYNNGIAEKRLIETSGIVGNQIIVSTGLEKGEIIIADRRVQEVQRISLENISIDENEKNDTPDENKDAQEPTEENNTEENSQNNTNNDTNLTPETK